MSTSQEFKEFILRGNVVDLAVGVIIGGAFGAIVAAFVKDIITPLIGIPGKVDLSAYKFTVNGSVFAVGDFLNTVIAFIILAAVVFFVIVKPINDLKARQAAGEPDATPEPTPEPTPDQVLLTEIRDSLRARV